MLPRKLCQIRIWSTQSRFSNLFALVWRKCSNVDNKPLCVVATKKQTLQQHMGCGGGVPSTWRHINTLLSLPLFSHLHQHYILVAYQKWVQGAPCLFCWPRSLKLKAFKLMSLPPLCGLSSIKFKDREILLSSTLSDLLAIVKQELWALCSKTRAEVAMSWLFPKFHNFPLRNMYFSRQPYSKTMHHSPMAFRCTRKRQAFLSRCGLAETCM